MFSSEGMSVVVKDGDGRAASLSCHVVSGTITTNKRGFEQARFKLRESAPQVTNGTLCVMSRTGETMWEGMVVDTGSVTGGLVDLVGYGYTAALNNVPYTAFWSDDSYGKWNSTTDQDTSTAFSGRTPEKYAIDTNNRLYIAPRKDETFNDSTDRASLHCRKPKGSKRDLLCVTFDWSVELFGQWQVQLISADDAWGNTTPEWTVANTGSGQVVQSGSETITLTGSDRCIIYFIMYRIPGTGSALYGGETGSQFLEIKNIRVTSHKPPVTVNDVVCDMIECAHQNNPQKIDNCKSLIADSASATDLTNVTYLEADTISAIEAFALADGKQRYCLSVWEGGVVQWQPVRDNPCAQKWFVPMAQIGNNFSTSNVYTGAYAIFEDANGVECRTEIIRDPICEALAGCVRIKPLYVPATNEADALNYVNAFMAECDQNLRNGQFVIDRCFCDRWRIRAGDTVCASNADVAPFVVGRTQYNLTNDTMTIWPEQPTPQLELLLANGS